MCSLRTAGFAAFIAATGSTGACAAPEQSTAPRVVELERLDQEFRTGWVGDGHEEITAAGLTMLDEDVVDDLAEANEAVDGPALCDETTWIDWFTPECPDTKLRSEFHFDNCRVGDAIHSVRLRYGKLVSALDPSGPDLSVATKIFGSILHTMQDFFAHSNWVDLGKSSLLADHGMLLPEAGPGAQIDGLRVLASPLPVDWYVKRASDSRVPLVWDGTSWSEGLITGTYADNVDSPLCVPAASIAHGDPFYQDGGHGDYLAKDDPDSWHHQRAIDVAVDQTTEELCRLDRLLRLRYGRAGHALLMSEWVDDDGGFEATCNRNVQVVTAVWTVAL